MHQKVLADGLKARLGREPDRAVVMKMKRRPTQGGRRPAKRDQDPTSRAEAPWRPSRPAVLGCSAFWGEQEGAGSRAVLGDRARTR